MDAKHNGNGLWRDSGDSNTNIDASVKKKHKREHKKHSVEKHDKPRKHKRKHSEGSKEKSSDKFDSWLSDTHLHEVISSESDYEVPEVDRDSDGIDVSVIKA